MSEQATMLSRRSFLTGLTAVAGGVLLDACAGPAQSSRDTVPTPSDSPTPEATPSEVAPHHEFAAKPSWEQDFTKLPDGTKLDERYWSIDTGNEIPGYNNEKQTLTDRPQNVRIEGGTLVIEARKEELNDRDYTSAHVNTQGKFKFMYGKIEVDARMPQGVGTWPALWLLADKADASWPDDGEIDFGETIGAEPNLLYPAIHTHDTEANGAEDLGDIKVPTMYKAFNTYGVEMSPGKIAFTLNGKTYKTVEQTSKDHNEWPFDQDYFLIINLAMGGDWGGEKKDEFPPDGIQGKGPWNLAVSGVRFYDYSA